MTAHPHAENMRLYAEDAAETDKPWERWERRYVGPMYGDHASWNQCTASECWWSLDWEYRRKPKPLECWVLVTVSGHIAELCSSLEEAESAASRGFSRQPRIAHMREVTE